MESSAASTPNTTGEGNSAIVKPMPIKMPCSRAVTLVPTTMARVTPLNCRNSRSLRSSFRGISRPARASMASPSRRKKNSKNNMIANPSNEPKAPRKTPPPRLAARFSTSRVPETSQP